MTNKSSDTFDGVEMQLKLAQARKKGILVALVCCLLIAVGLYFSGIFQSPNVAVAAGQDPSTRGATWAQPGIVMNGGDFIVNLNDEDALRYAKVGFALLMSEQVDLEVAKTRLPLVKDGILPFLMSKQSKELATPEGFEEVREALTRKAQAVYPFGQVQRAVITQLIVQ